MAPSPLKKTSDWESKLVAYLNQEIGKPFVWGTRDCTSFALNCLKQMVGEFKHPMLDYTNEKEAMLFQLRIQYGLYDFMRLHFDVTPIEKEFAQRGDILFIRQGRFECCHILMGSTFVSVSLEKGVGVHYVKALPASNQRFLRVN